MKEKTEWQKCEVERNMNSKSSVKYWPLIEMDVCLHKYEKIKLTPDTISKFPLE